MRHGLLLEENDGSGSCRIDIGPDITTGKEIVPSRWDEEIRICHSGSEIAIPHNPSDLRNFREHIDCDILVCLPGEEDQGFFWKEGGAGGRETRMNKGCSNRLQGLFPRENTFSHENIVQMGKDFINEPFTAGAGMVIAI
jgi:hypothetical protein